MIQEQFMRELYVRTIQQYNRQPNDAEFKAWMAVLSENHYSDVDLALRQWAGNTTTDMHTGRIAGGRMPSPAEIKLWIQSADRSQSEKFQCCEKCEHGWVRVFEGKTIAGNQIDKKTGAVKRCQCWLAWIEYKKGVSVSGKPKLVARKHEQPQLTT